MNFMNELKQRLTNRQVEIDENNTVYKEYNAEKGGFIEISKEEREVKA